LYQEEAVKRQQAFAKKLEEIHEEEERKKEEEDRKRQQTILEKRIAELQEAVEKKKIEDAQKRRVMMEQIYGMRYPNPYNNASLGFDEAPINMPLSRVLPKTRLGGGSNNNGLESDWDYYKRPWNSRDYVHSALHSDNLVLEDVYFEAPLPMLADVYKKLDEEKKRIKDIMRQRIIQGEKW
jgi:hypothetical protein